VPVDDSLDHVICLQGDRVMDRRAFVSSSLAAAAVLAAPHAGLAQQRLRRVALISPIVPVEAMTESGDVRWRAVLSELRRLGLVEGQNIAFERYSAMSQHSRFEVLGAAVAATKPDVIFVGADTVIARAAAAADRGVPVVFLVTNALASGLVGNLARPGGNLTGVNTTSGFDVEDKRMALLQEAIPAAKRIAFVTSQPVWDEGQGYGRGLGHRTRAAAAKLGLSLIPMLVDPSDLRALRRAFATIAEQGGQALHIPQNTANIVAIASITALTVAARLPGIAASDEFVAGGGLMVYGPVPGEMWRRAAGYIVRILNGERAGDLPVQQPDTFNLIINMKAAKALGITIPPALLVQATEVID
jgi:putative ABC transport system substrate-binding protein